MKTLYLGNHPTPALCLFLALVFFTSPVSGQGNPDLFISNRNTDSVRRYDGDTGESLGNFVDPGDGGLDRPQEVFFHPHTHDLLVTGFTNVAIKLYDGETGDFIRNFTDPNEYSLSNPTKISLGPDSNLYVSQWGAIQNAVVKFDLETGAFLGEFTSTGVPEGCGMVWDDQDNLYVTSWGNGDAGKVYQFDANGISQGVFIDTNPIRGPVGIWIGENKEFFVVDWSLGRVNRYDSTGQHLGIFISGMTRIEGNTFASDGSILLCDWEDDNINHYSSDGTFISTPISGNGLNSPNSITFGPPLASSTGAAAINKYLTLEQNYPNPFRQSTEIRFHSTRSVPLMVRIIDSNGQEVDRLFDDILPAGDHNLVWEARGMPSGVYFCELQTAEGKISMKMKLITTK